MWKKDVFCETLCIGDNKAEKASFLHEGLNKGHM